MIGVIGAGTGAYFLAQSTESSLSTSALRIEEFATDEGGADLYLVGSGGAYVMPCSLYNSPSPNGSSTTLSSMVLLPPLFIPPSLVSGGTFSAASDDEPSAAGATLDKVRSVSTGTSVGRLPPTRRRRCGSLSSSVVLETLRLALLRSRFLNTTSPIDEDEEDEDEEDMAASTIAPDGGGGGNEGDEGGGRVLLSTFSSTCGCGGGIFACDASSKSKALIGEGFNADMSSLPAPRGLKEGDWRDEDGDGRRLLGALSTNLVCDSSTKQIDEFADLGCLGESSSVVLFLLLIIRRALMGEGGTEEEDVPPTPPPPPPPLAPPV